MPGREPGLELPYPRPDPHGHRDSGASWFLRAWYINFLTQISRDLNSRDLIPGSMRMPPRTRKIIRPYMCFISSQRILINYHQPSFHWCNDEDQISSSCITRSILAILISMEPHGDIAWSSVPTCDLTCMLTWASVYWYILCSSACVRENECISKTFWRYSGSESDDSGGDGSGGRGSTTVLMICVCVCACEYVCVFIWLILWKGEYMLRTWFSAVLDRRITGGQHVTRRKMAKELIWTC